MSDLITSDSPLSDTQRATLDTVLSALIPADAESGMPSAAELDFVGYLQEFAPDAVASVANELDQLEETAQRRNGTSVSELASDELLILIEQIRATSPRFGYGLQVQVLSCYYQDDRVVTALGMEARPPFPEGNEVVSGDLSLLDPVRNRGQIYREAD